MGKYIKENHIINATEKAYKVVYKEQGFVPYNEVEEKKEEKDLTEMKKEELIAIAEAKGIEITSKATKEEIINLINEVEEKKEEASE